MFYGYARVSTKEQNEDRQIIALHDYKIDEKNIFIDKESGKNFKRENYLKLIKKIKHGDVIVVKSIDRLGRNYTEIIQQWRLITQEKKTDIIVIDMPLLNTTKNKDLFGSFISDLVLQILSFVAENERVNIKKRQAEGIAIAKIKGVKFGRKRKYSMTKVAEFYVKVRRKELSVKEAVKIMEMSESSYYRIVREIKDLGIEFI
ncbi:MAG: recombinase family protein [Clostridiales bacterium]|nr:recombinase family protein [Clostridiales bacterium]